MKTIMFPGQGSQNKGMGADLFDAFPELTARADDILGYSIKERCLADPHKDLKQTQVTQPALYVVSALAYYHNQQQAAPPDFVLGHSLGEYNALLAAGAFDFETGLKLVQKRGELMSQAADGKMAAVINASQSEIERILRDNGLHQIDLANFNTPSQIVISGAADEIERARALFQSGTMKCVPLNTSAAFHSRFMQSARDTFAAFLQQFDFAPLTIPVIANISARPYPEGAVAAHLADQITGSVRWFESIQYLKSQGSMQFEEVGHGQVLTKMLAKIEAEAPAPTPAPIRAAAAVSEPPKTMTAQEKVNHWNRHYPTGTKVLSTIVEEEPLETRTQAVVLFGHRAAVYMKGYNGYFDLDEVTPCP